MVVCDVSAKNPNVMFELGMRLAFDKPTVIVKDDKTDFIFDTGVIEHLSYPRDLRFQKIISFKDQLAKKIAATYSAYTNNSDYTTFLKHFGEFKIASVPTREVTNEEFVTESLKEIYKVVNQVNTTLNSSKENRTTIARAVRVKDPIVVNEMSQKELLDYLITFCLERTSSLQFLILNEEDRRKEIENLLSNFSRRYPAITLPYKVTDVVLAALVKAFEPPF